ncbi:MAG: hypothetical protein JXA49_03855 [Actinobacteria bacterium]|nr:hypothetical protein [Actinomycetota bacterium]
MVGREEILKEIDKAKKWKAFFMIFAAGLFVVGAVLVVLFVAGDDIPALLLGIVSFVWSAVMINQLLKTNELIDLMNARIEGFNRNGTAEDLPGTQTPGSRGSEPGEP